MRLTASRTLIISYSLRLATCNFSAACASWMPTPSFRPNSCSNLSQRIVSSLLQGGCSAEIFFPHLHRPDTSVIEVICWGLSLSPDTQLGSSLTFRVVRVQDTFLFALLLLSSPGGDLANFRLHDFRVAARKELFCLQANHFSGGYGCNDWASAQLLTLELFSQSFAMASSTVFSVTVPAFSTFISQVSSVLGLWRRLTCISSSSSATSFSSQSVS
mmetsp:Transcript_29704/g.70792  ORF Transcript_29704/g.70792 Transcript_29704/m.70792 type:complete len:216 (+) Transcript_29704:1142-1789(+)